MKSMRKCGINREPQFGSRSKSEFRCHFVNKHVCFQVEARGHVIGKMPEIPMVIANEIEGLTKTKEAVALLKKISAYDDVEKSIASQRMRGTKGKMRNRRWRMKRGPLVIYKNDNGITRAFRYLNHDLLSSTFLFKLLCEHKITIEIYLYKDIPLRRCTSIKIKCKSMKNIGTYSSVEHVGEESFH